MRKKKSIGQIWKEDEVTRSGLETKSLELLKKNKIPYEYEPKDKKLKYQTLPTNHTYLPDVILEDGTILEIKGYFSAENRKKMVHIKRCHPERRIVMVFQSNNYIRKGSKTTYLDWCRKEGIEAIMFKDLENFIKTTLHGK